jgi:hypothetical protein
MNNGTKLVLQTIIDEWTSQHVTDVEEISEAYSGDPMTPEAEAVWIKMQAIYRKMVDDATEVLATLPDE